MDQELLKFLQRITAEAQAILDGRTAIDRDLYMQRQGKTINAQKLLAAGKLITIRPHTRFIHFPEYTVIMWKWFICTRERQSISFFTVLTV